MDLPEPYTLSKLQIAWCFEKLTPEQVIGQMIQTQATLLAYIDVFHLCAITAALMIPLVLVLVRRVNIGATSAAIGH